MGIAIPQVITPSKASGAQVIDGSLKFDEDAPTYLKKTFSSTGNRNVWTWSGWVKIDPKGDNQICLFSAYTATNNAGYGMLWFNSDGGTLNFHGWDGGSDAATSDAKFRDNGWYHVVARHDESATPKMKLYVNGELLSLESNLGTSTGISRNIEHRIGYEVYNNRKPYEGSMSQVYFIDAQALGPEYFGFTDQLTNTWKPKKYTGTFTQSSPNNGTTWTSNTTSGSGTIANAYDGDSSTWCNITSGNTFTLTPPSTIVADTVEVWLDTDTPASFSINGGTFSSENTYSGLQFVSVATDVSLTSLAIKGGSGGTGIGLRGIRINGEILLDGFNNTGSNSFYLPMDGNSPIGKDQSGNGNDWRPMNFGGSVELDKATGAKPILNTTQGGAQAGVGVFGSRQNVGYAVTVYNDGGGNKYYIDGVKQDTVTGLIRGATYTFDTSDSTVSSHPFRFSATSNGSHGGGSEYTNGVAAITGAATTITVPHDAPNTLYYYCTSHSGMGADITGITTNEKLADQYAWKCVLAMPLIADKEDVSASIACTSTTKTITQNGSPAYGRLQY